MPLRFWVDLDFSSYFSQLPGIWCHGDRAKFNPRARTFVLRRSDATRNRYGVRTASAKIYRTLVTFPDITDSLIICVEAPGGGSYMPSFMAMAAGDTLTYDPKSRITNLLKTNRSPPPCARCDTCAPAIALTLAGKIMEVPVRKLLLGATAETVASRDATMNPEALDWLAAFAVARRTG